MNQGLGIDPIPGLTKITPDNTFLLVKNGPKANQQIPLNQMYLIIGRNSPPNVTVNIDLTEYELGIPPMISRQHAVIQWVNDSLQICDLNSRNGTAVNQQKLAPSTPGQSSPFCSLKFGDIITLGNLEFEVISHE
jgi:pSer/pThr/pTyr-binding forkhead associated (FHA) protein